MIEGGGALLRAASTSTNSYPPVTDLRYTKRLLRSRACGAPRRRRRGSRSGAAALRRARSRRRCPGRRAPPGRAARPPAVQPLRRARVDASRPSKVVCRAPPATRAESIFIAISATTLRQERRRAAPSVPVPGAQRVASAVWHGRVGQGMTAGWSGGGCRRRRRRRRGGAPRAAAPRGVEHHGTPRASATAVSGSDLTMKAAISTAGIRRRGARAARGSNARSRMKRALATGIRNAQEPIMTGTPPWVHPQQDHRIMQRRVEPDAERHEARRAGSCPRAPHEPPTVSVSASPPRAARRRASGR